MISVYRVKAWQAVGSSPVYRGGLPGASGGLHSTGGLYRLYFTDDSRVVG